MKYYDEIGFRPIEERDLELMRQLRNEESTWMSLTDPHLVTERQQKLWFEKITTASDRAYFSVFRVESTYPIKVIGEFIGIIRMDEYDTTNRSARIGCDVVPEKRGIGYGTKIFKAIMQYLFNNIGLHRLWLLVLEDNDVAIRLYKGVGFREDGLMRQAVYRDGRYKDYIVMSLLHDEYREYCRNGLYDIKTPDTKYVPGA